MKKMNPYRELIFMMLTVLALTGVSYGQEVCLYAGTGPEGDVFKKNITENTWGNTGEFLPEGRISALLYHSQDQSIYAAVAQIPGSIHPRIYKSTDLGGHWSLLGEFQGLDIIRCFMEGKNGDIWAGTAYYGVILHSVNGGITWDRIMLENVATVYDLHETESGYYLAGVSGGRVFLSTDGDAWYPIVLPGTEAVYTLAETETGELIAGTGPMGELFVSMDQGINWNPSSHAVPDSSELLDIAVLPGGGIFIMSRNSFEGQIEVWQAPDLTIPWMFTAPVYLGDAQDIMAAPDGRVYLGGGSPGQVLYWQSGATNWESAGTTGSSDIVYNLAYGACESSIEPTPTFTPRPTHTPREESGSYNQMSYDYFNAGQRFLYVVDTFKLPDKQQGAAMPDPLHLYVALEVYGQFYFYSLWTNQPEYLVLDSLPPGMTNSVTILDFTWPDAGGSAMNLTLWSVVLDAATGDLYGEYDQSDFDYGPPPETPTPPPDATPTPVIADMSIEFINADEPLGWECGDERLYCFGDCHFRKECLVVRVINTGGGNLPVNIGLAGSHPNLFFPLTANDFTLSPGESRDVVVAFDPSGVPETKTAIMVVSGAGEQHQIDLQAHFVY